MDEPQKPPVTAFAYKAARLSLWLPLPLMFCGSCIAHFGMFEDQASGSSYLLRMSVGTIAIGWAATALVLAILALIAVPRLGTRGLLVYGIGGMVFSGFALFLLVATFFPRPATVTMSREMTGNWTSTFVIPGKGIANTKLELASNGKAHWNMVVGESSVDVRGTWQVRTRPPVLEIVSEGPQASASSVDRLTCEIGEVTE
jgi:hypothetical protein